MFAGRSSGQEGWRRLAAALPLIVASTFGQAEGPAEQVELVRQTGHSVVTAAISPDGRFLVSAGGNSMKIWETANGRLLHTSPASSTSSIDDAAMAFSGDGQRVALATQRQRLIVWAVPSGNKLFDVPYSSWKNPSLALSRRGDRVAVRFDRHVSVYSVATGQQLFRLPISSREHGGGASALAFDSRGHLVHAALQVNSPSVSPKITRWDVLSGHQVELIETKYPIEADAIALSEDAALMTLMTRGGDVAVFELNTGREVARTRVSGGDFDAPSASVSRDGKRLVVFRAASPSTKGVLQVIELESGRQVYSGSLGSFGTAALGPSGKVGFFGQSLKNLDTNEVRFTLPDSNSGGIEDLVLSESGMQMVWSRSLGTMVMDLERGEARSFGWNCHMGNQRLSASGDLLVCRRPPGEVLLRAGETFKQIGKWELGYRDGLALHPEAKVLALDVGGRRVELRNIPDGSMRKSLTLEPLTHDTRAQVLAMEFDDTGRALWIRTREGIYRIDIDSGLTTRSISFSATSPAPLLDLSRVGRSVASASVDDVSVWNTGDGTLRWSAKTPLGGSPNALASSSDGRLLALATWGDQYGITVWDLATGRMLSADAVHTGIIDSLAFIPGSHLLMSGSEDGTIGIWNAGDAERLATIWIPSLGRDWVAASRYGFFEGTQSAWSKVALRVASLPGMVFEPEQFLYHLYEPGMLARIVRERRSIHSILAYAGDPRARLDLGSYRDSKQPGLRIVDTTFQNVPLGDTHINREIEVVLEAEDRGSGLRDLRVFRNGLLVHTVRGDLAANPATGRWRGSAPVTLVNDENEISAYVFNRDNVKSKNVEVAHNWHTVWYGPGKTYILGVGITRYANSDFDLRHAATDASRINGVLASAVRALGRHPVPVELIDEQATKQNILAALSLLAGTTDSLPPGAPQELATLGKVEPEDNVIVFFSGHGTARKDGYYLIPHDLGYTGPRESVTAQGRNTIFERSISDRELELAIEQIDAHRIMLVLDACQAGQVLESDERRRGPINTRGFAQLAFEKGIYVLAATQSYAAAVEFEKQGSGLLTYTLIDRGIAARLADTNGNGVITVEEWFDHAVRAVPAEFEAADKLYTARLGKSIDYSESPVVGQIPQTYYRPRERTERWQKVPDPWLLVGSSP